MTAAYNFLPGSLACPAQGASERVFMAEAENPCFFGFDAANSPANRRPGAERLQ